MAEQRRGFTLVEAMIAVVLLTAVVAVYTRTALGVVSNVATGRRWTAMALATTGEIAQLEQRYRRGAPACLVPADGGAVTADGVAVDWRVIGDSTTATATIEVRATDRGQVLVDSVRTGFRCR